MARGFESKDVEFQQAERERQRSHARAEAVEVRRRGERSGTIELSLARARSDLGAATSPAHRRMLEAAISALEGQLQAIESSD